MPSILGLAADRMRKGEPARRGVHNGSLALAMCTDLAKHFDLGLDVTRTLLAQHACDGHAATLQGWRDAAAMLASAGMAGAPYQPVVH